MTPPAKGQSWIPQDVPDARPRYVTKVDHLFVEWKEDGAHYSSSRLDWDRWVKGSVATLLGSPIPPTVCCAGCGLAVGCPDCGRRWPS